MTEGKNPSGGGITADLPSSDQNADAVMASGSAFLPWLENHNDTGMGGWVGGWMSGWSMNKMKRLVVDSFEFTLQMRGEKKKISGKQQHPNL